jgi:hypothetical protein
MTTFLGNTQCSDFKVNFPGLKTKHGSLYWPITRAESSHHPRMQLCKEDAPLRLPFGVSTFEGNARLNLDMSISENNKDIKEWFNNFDQWVINTVFKNRHELFPKKPNLTIEGLTDMYTPCLNSKDDFDPILRTKANSSVLLFVRNEDGSSAKGTLDDITPGTTCCPIVSIDKVWCMSASKWGVTLVTQAIQIWPRKERALSDIFQF